MGIELVKRALIAAAETNLGHTATRLLVYMATRALDTDTAPVYSAGREHSEAALGYEFGPQGHRALKKVTSDLVASGLITRQRIGNRGGPAVYGLNLAKWVPEDSTLYRKWVPEEAPLSEQRRPVSGTQSPRKGTSERPKGYPQMSERVPPEAPPRRDEEQEGGRAPSRFCDRHPNGTTAPCGACGEARKRADAWNPPRKPPRSHTHRFDPVSGYCDGCELREDAA